MDIKEHLTGICVGVLCVLCVGWRAIEVTAAQAQAPPPVHTVYIDAVAVDGRGQIVRNLKASDFEIREDVVPRPIEAVRFGSAGRGRLFAVYLDEYHVSAGE